MFCRLDRAVAVFNVSVVLLDCLLHDSSRVGVLVVDICHHLCGDPHRPPVVDPEFRVQRGHDQEPNARRQAIQKVGILDSRLDECLTFAFDPTAVVNIVRVELLQHELVPCLISSIGSVSSLGVGLCSRA